MKKKLVAETLGTFAMIFCGCGAMTINEITNGGIGHIGVAIVWGLIVMSMIYAFGETSGAHFNPAVTIGFAAAKKFSWQKVPFYVIAQAIGAISAIFILWFLFPESEFLGETTPRENFPAYKAAILEFLLTFFLMLTIINVSTGSKEIGTMAAIAVGGIILLEAMFAAFKAGYGVVPINFRLHPNEFAFIINDSEAEVLIVSPEFNEQITRIRGQLPHVRDRAPGACLRPRQAERGDGRPPRCRW